ncbi:MAG: hypothetical protein U1D06_11730, partial [Paracoccaceae bacterium]|nr:hypothetical protein [Paracoccaceae bacterium]
MLMPLLRLFDRYCARHLYLTQPGPAVPQAQGRMPPSSPSSSPPSSPPSSPDERIHQITRRGNRLEVTGQVR